MTRMMMAMSVAGMFAMSGLVSAQSGTAMKKDEMAKEVMVTGCVAQSADMSHFMLNNAMMSGAMTDMKKETTPMAGKPMSYMLTGDNLKAHVGHKVEVTGMIDDKKMDMSKDKMAKDSMGKEMAMGASLTAKSVKMISTTCP